MKNGFEKRIRSTSSKCQFILARNGWIPQPKACERRRLIREEEKIAISSHRFWPNFQKIQKLFSLSQFGADTRTGTGPNEDRHRGRALLTLGQALEWP